MFQRKLRNKKVLYKCTLVLNTALLGKVQRVQLTVNSVRKNFLGLVGSQSYPFRAAECCVGAFPTLL